ncbi:phosphopantothenoylcysteine decarboxylase isoform X4 [Tupaia chinensis]|uniref:phosphopantothenoylcysteine decarboxylase isoform X4 n=1 Tax=Tupaia chinensis TaxID=246437 RepID=UPI000FFBD576|nr:phosphopantothenoylcysteine decarboxylase isoform X4 [Tupaia chinensis]
MELRPGVIAEREASGPHMEPSASCPAPALSAGKTFRVLVGVTGSVAALKLPLLVSRLLDIPGKSPWSPLREPSISTAPRTSPSPCTATPTSGRCGSAARTQFSTLTCDGGQTSCSWPRWMPTPWGRWPAASATTCLSGGHG